MYCFIFLCAKNWSVTMNFFGLFSSLLHEINEIVWFTMTNDHNLFNSTICSAQNFACNKNKKCLELFWVDITQPFMNFSCSVESVLYVKRRCFMIYFDKHGWNLQARLNFWMLCANSNQAKSEIIFDRLTLWSDTYQAYVKCARISEQVKKVLLVSTIV